MKALGIAASAGILAVILGATPLACGSGFTAGAPDAGTDGSTASDGPTPETGSGDAGGDTAVPTEGGDGPATSGNIVYVSPTGNDGNTGLQSSAPKLTVTSALAEAKTLPLPREVHVCKGTYAEDAILVDFDLKLYGAFDCTTWEQTATYGYPHPDGVDLTVLASPDTTMQEASLVVTGGVTRSAVIDGFSIAGPPTTGAHTDGVRVTGTASPTLSNDVVAGGSGQAALATGATGSVGILVDLQAAPEIEECIVSGGNGRGTVGSAGVELDSTGGVSLHDSIVTGGTGQTLVASTSSGTATIGVDVRASLTTPLSALLVDGTDVAGTSGQSIGLRIAGSGVAASVGGCYIEGGLGLDSTAGSLGVVVDTPGGGVTFVDDHLYGGQRTVGVQQTIGVLVVAAGSFTLENSLIHGGTVQSNATGAFTVGVDLSAVASPVIAFDTIYTGASPGTDIALNSGVAGLLVRDDLLLGSDASGGAIGVAATQCGGVVSSLDHTAFGNLQTLYQCTSGGSTTTATNLTELGLDLGTAESKNVAVQAACISGDTACATFTGCPGTSCLSGIFGMTWSTDDGVSALFGSPAPDAGASVDGWTLVPGASCAIASGGTTYGSVMTDVYGHPRNGSTPTMGAVEYPSPPKCGAN